MNERTKTDVRKKYNPKEKFKIIKEVLTTDSSVSEVCKKHGINPALFYRWQESFFQGAIEGLERRKNGPTTQELRKIEKLERENDRMKGVIAEITAENIDIKKSIGEL